MTSTFSTFINFSMYGLLQRLHRLHIQTRLESEVEETGICYPRVLAHAKKVGFLNGNAIGAFNLQDITNESITNIVKSARDEAISSIKELGMLVKEGKWEEVTLKLAVPKDGEADDDDDDANDDGDNKKKSEPESDCLSFEDERQWTSG